MGYQKHFENYYGWAEVKGLIKKENQDSQYLKTVEEIGELSVSIQKKKTQDTIDAIGDITVCLSILSYQKGLTPEKLMNLVSKMREQVVTKEEAERRNLHVQYISFINKASADYYMYSVGEDLLLAFHHLFFVAKLLGHDLSDCMEFAWNEIKGRTGKLVDGNFVKDAATSTVGFESPEELEWQQRENEKETERKF
jgi:hypothetical protein